MPNRSLKRLERDLVLLVGIPLLLLIIGVFAFSYYGQKSNRAASSGASQQAMRLCLSTNKARREGNRDVRGPVRATASELATILQLAARQQPDPAKRQKTLQLAAKFAGYAARVQDLPQLNCNP